MASTPPRWGDGVVPSYDAIAEQGRVCDLGCGPGQVARYLAAHGVDTFGIDASESMVATAPRLNPTLQFRQADFFRLPLGDGELASVAAFYCLIHCAHGELGRAVVEIRRVLMPAGRFLMAVHAGEGEVGRDAAYGRRVALVATLFSEDEVCAALTAAGFRLDDLVTREPYPLEYPSRRIYSTATCA